MGRCRLGVEDDSLRTHDAVFDPTSSSPSRPRNCYRCAHLERRVSPITRQSSEVGISPRLASDCRRPVGARARRLLDVTAALRASDDGSSLSSSFRPRSGARELLDPALDRGAFARPLAFALARFEDGSALAGADACACLRGGCTDSERGRAPVSEQGGRLPARRRRAARPLPAWSGPRSRPAAEWWPAPLQDLRLRWGPRRSHVFGACLAFSRRCRARRRGS